MRGVLLLGLVPFLAVIVLLLSVAFEGDGATAGGEERVARARRASAGVRTSAYTERAK
jgi:hypothetical protein